MVAVPQLIWEVHCLAKFTNYFYFYQQCMDQLVGGGGGLPTQKAGNIVKCGKRDDAHKCKS